MSMHGRPINGNQHHGLKSDKVQICNCCHNMTLEKDLKHKHFSLSDVTSVTPFIGLAYIDVNLEQCLRRENPASSMAELLTL